MSLSSVLLPAGNNCNTRGGGRHQRRRKVDNAADLDERPAGDERTHYRAREIYRVQVRERKRTRNIAFLTETGQIRCDWPIKWIAARASFYFGLAL